MALENVTIRAEIERVADRTAVMNALNTQLEKEIEQQWTFAAEVYRQSVTDDLTGLLNRRGFLKRAERLLESLLDAGQPASVLFLDLDGLKQVNDTEGHDAGDRLLVEAADLLRTLFRDRDLLARVGGDEFAVLLPGVTDVQPVAERLRARTGRVRLSMGAALFDPGDPRGVDELLGAADEQMYDDKRARRTG